LMLLNLFFSSFLFFFFSKYWWCNNSEHTAAYGNLAIVRYLLQSERKTLDLDSSSWDERW
jgi:hypothetical protein